MNDGLKDKVIENPNLSLAWAEAFLKVHNSRNREITPLIVSITDLNNSEPQEVKEIRDSLDALHKKRETGLSCETTANTIFPKSLWIPGKGKNELYKRYKEIAQKIMCGRNNRGTYFYRLINYQESVNQLDCIINTRKNKIYRRSAYVASVFDPRLDHTGRPYGKFPCLHQVSFVPCTQKRTLAINAFYAYQDIFPHAYGNYLGLCRLGLFVAHEMELKLDRMTCFSGIINIGSPRSKEKFADYVAEFEDIEKLARAIIAQQTGNDGYGDE